MPRTDHAAILQALSTTEAAVLKLAATRIDTTIADTGRRLSHWILENELINNFGVARDAVNEMDAHLARLGLWTSRIETVFAALDPLASPEQRVLAQDPWSGLPLGTTVSRRLFVLTPLGLEIARAIA